MANPEHVEVVWQRAAAIDAWRHEHPEYAGGELAGFDDTDFDLRGADLSEANLHDSNLRSANLTGADLHGADLVRANLSGAILVGANLIGANLIGAHLSYANLHDANLTDARVDLTELRGADLSGSDFTRAELTDANFAEADLSGANLTETDLVHASFTGGNLRGADFSDATFASTVLGADLSEAIGLSSISHIGPSVLGLNTLQQSKNLPDEFLRGVGLPDDMIALYHSWQGVIQFYSCFISYSTTDQAYADRLYADLQANGVRSWLATEDLKIGDRFRQRIDEAIRLHDKLVVVLSETSVASAWVEDEIEAALEKERQTGRDVLFPITLDGAVFKTEAAWAAKIRRERHIGDFAAWKDADTYREKFDRLLRDLRAVQEPS